MSDRQDTYTVWASERSTKPERIVAFRSWVYATLANTLRWPVDRGQRERMIGQAAHWVERMVSDLGAHGFLFAPRQLAELIEKQLKLVRDYQDRGEVRCPWSYLRTVWERYVAERSDALRNQAMSLGCHAQQIASQLLAAGPAQPVPAPSIPEIMLEVQRARAAQRKAKAALQSTRPPKIAGTRLELL